MSTITISVILKVILNTLYKLLCTVVLQEIGNMGI